MAARMWLFSYSAAGRTSSTSSWLDWQSVGRENAKLRSQSDGRHTGYILSITRLVFFLTLTTAIPFTCQADLPNCNVLYSCTGSIATKVTSRNTSSPRSSFGGGGTGTMGGVYWCSRDEQRRRSGTVWPVLSAILFVFWLTFSRLRSSSSFSDSTLFGGPPSAEAAVAGLPGGG